MCTLLTVSRGVWDADPTMWCRRIMDDARTNSDGVAVLMATQDGRYTSLRTLDVDAAVGLLTVSDWVRCWVHTRFGTGGEASLENTHGFCARGVWYMHNGALRQPPARSLPVDSMAIGKWLQDGTVYDNLDRESFANVFIVSPKEGLWTVVRQVAGSLYTDGEGNFATVATGSITQPVPQRSKLSFYGPKWVERPRWSRTWSSTAPKPAQVADGGAARTTDPEYWRRLLERSDD